MLGTKDKLVLPLAVLALALSACAHTKVTNVWRDPGHQGYPKRVLVHAMAMSPTVKIVFENLLVERLKSAGVDALPSHKHLPDSMVLDKEAMKRLVREQGIDAIFVAHPTDRRETESFGSLRWQETATVYFDPDGGFVMAAFGTTLAPEIITSEEATIEFVLFDVAARKRVWVLLAKTFVLDTRTGEVEPAVDLVVERLRADRMIP